MSRDTPPPRVWAMLARLLITGADAPLIRDDLDESYARDVKGGMAPRRARRRYAWNVVGSVWSVRARRLRGIATHGALLDVKLGMRMLVKQPLLTLVAMLAIGLGIPASLSVFHLLDAMRSPLPVPEGHRVVGIRTWARDTGEILPASVHELSVWRESLRSFEAIAATRSYLVNVHAGDPGVPAVRAAAISASAFQLLRSPPLLGRVFDAADEVTGADDVVILGEDLWASRFARDPDLIGKTVRIGRTEHTVVGVMPASFRFPTDEDVWLPLRASPDDYVVGEGPELFVFGRLADGVTKEAADLDMALLTERLADDFPGVYAHRVGQVVGASVLVLEEEEIEASDPELLLGQSIVLMLLLLVCGNVGTLVLARTATRSGEISIRSALGASRSRIVAQLFTETLVLAVVAVALGLAAGEAVGRWLTSLVVPLGGLPYWIDLTLRPQTVLIALGLAALSAVVAGVLPALKATSRGVRANLQRAAAGGTMRFGLGSTVLIVSEVVLSVGFLAVGGVLVRSVFQDTEGRLGFEPERYLVATLHAPWNDPAQRFDEGRGPVGRARDVQVELLRRLTESEEVRGVGMGTALPGTTPRRIVVAVEGRPGFVLVPGGVGTTQVGIGFFRGLGRPILAGRDFTAADVEGDSAAHRPAAIVNTTFVDEVLEGRNPIGQRIRQVRSLSEDPAQYEWYEIVGVVGPFGMNAINPSRDAGIYHPMAGGEIDPINLMVEVGDDPESFASDLRALVADVDPEATLDRVMPLPEMIAVRERFFRWAFLAQVVLAAVAFLLSVTGLYAMMSFTVAQRTREIGVRTALGARQWSIVSTIARRAGIQLGVGLTLGALFAWIILLRFTRNAIVLPVDIPLTLAVTLAGAGAVGVLACIVPTLRGLRIPPTEALREG